MAIPLAALLAGGGGGLSALLGGGAAAGAGGAAGAAGAGGMTAGLSKFAVPGAPGAVGGTPMASGGMAASKPGFWQQFSSMYGGGGGSQAAPQGGAPSNPFTSKLGPGAQLATGYLDNLENRAGRLGEMLRGPTMPFLPHLNTSQVGPNKNPGQIGLSHLLAQIATRRG